MRGSGQIRVRARLIQSVRGWDEGLRGYMAGLKQKDYAAVISAFDRMSSAEQAQREAWRLIDEAGSEASAIHDGYDPARSSQYPAPLSAVAATIERAITEGQYQPGQRLFSERDLADQLGVSRPTARRAVIALEMRGLLESRQGSGVYVRRTNTGSAHHRAISTLERSIRPKRAGCSKVRWPPWRPR
jgi:DNA-binding transcriptional regulator YhcF (GntR family)